MLEKYVTMGNYIPAFETNKYHAIHDHLEYLRNREGTQARDVEPAYAWPERYNFYAYARLIGLEDVQIYPTMLLNGMQSPRDFDPEVHKTLLVPLVQDIETVLSDSEAFG